jgi:hypothetical protein
MWKKLIRRIRYWLCLNLKHMYKFTAMPFSSLVYIFLATINIVLHIASFRFNSNGQRVIQGQPSESPSNNNNNGAANTAAAGSAMSPSAGCADSSSHPSSAASSSNNNNDGRDAAGTPLSDAATERSTPDDIRTSRRESPTSKHF